MTTPDGDPTEGRSGRPVPGAPPGPVPPRRAGIERLLADSLLLAYIPAVFLIAAALGAFVYAIVVFVYSVRAVVRSPYPVGNHVGLFLLDIDLFLIGATLLISAVGFYELFIGDSRRDEAPFVPSWLEMNDLNDLKRRIIAMIVMMLSVSFVEVVVDTPHGRETLELGIGIAAVILALTVFVRWGGHGSGPT